MSDGVPFGFDGSELLQLDWEAEDWGENLGPKLMERLETAQNRQKRGVSFENWKRRKEAENRLKRRLLRDIEAEEKVEKAANSQLKAHQRELNKAKVARWRLQKTVEDQSKRQQAKVVQKRLKAAEVVKRTESRMSYMNWLRADLGKRKRTIEESGHMRGKSVGNRHAGRPYSVQGRAGQRDGKHREKAVHSVSAMRGYGANSQISGPQLLAYSLNHKSDLSGFSQHSRSSPDYLKSLGLHPSRLEAADDWRDISVEVRNGV